MDLINFLKCRFIHLNTECPLNARNHAQKKTAVNRTDRNPYQKVYMIWEEITNKEIHKYTR